MTLTANLGIALANSGATTAVLDADFGLRNLDLLLGLEIALFIQPKMF